MNANAVFLAAAAIGLVAQGLAILAIIWRGGQLVGSINVTSSILADEVRLLRTSRDDHAVLLARLGALLDSVEKRVGRIEGG